MVAANFEVQMDYNENFVAARKRSGMNKSELAAKTSASRQHISMIEHGQRIPSWKVAIEIADALGVSLDELAGRASPPG